MGKHEAEQANELRQGNFIEFCDRVWDRWLPCSASSEEEFLSHVLLREREAILGCLKLFGT